MRRLLKYGFVLFLVIVGLAIGSRAQAVIQVLLPLQKVIGDSNAVLVAHVERVDPDKPALVLVADRALKGTANLERMPISLKGDAESDKESQRPELLKRLAPDLPVVLFVQKQDDGYMVLAYTNGTWFQVLGRRDGDSVRWAYTHCEVYLRRSFKGTTAEMEQAVSDFITKKKRPPAPNPKEPAGLGPEVETAGK